MMLRVMAAATPPLVINVFSCWGEDLCGGSLCPALSDCAGTGGGLATDVVCGFDGLARRVEKS